MFGSLGFRLLTGSGTSTAWHAELDACIRICRELVRAMNVDIRAGRLEERSCLLGTMDELNQGVWSLGRRGRPLLQDYELDLESPFEDVASIAGGVWPVAELHRSSADDAILKLRFAAMTKNLPMHSHEHSDRVIIVIEGQGTFHVSPDPIEAYSGAGIRSTPVSEGQVLVFSRGVVHTFETESDPLLLMSYHAPFIPLEDSRQFEIARSEC
ncbi:MAG: cupin domain-containing protein [Planctomycetales bacterium]|nr:cupin domain-containing protein [Planctomycetales bacterium]